jgi:ribosomal protein S27E
MAESKLRTDTKGEVATTGAAAFVTGLGCSGCALITVIGIPALIITLPVALVGLIMLIASPFLKTKDVKCPKCGLVSHVLLSRKSFKCKECESIVAFDEHGKPKI